MCHLLFYIIIGNSVVRTLPKEYRTVKEFNSDEYIVKRSRFIGYAKPVTNIQEANDFISEIKSKHWDATHNVYAYIIRETGVKRYSDDGEPQGTAGIPVLDVLEKSGVTDCAVVVTRYFGGIMLGAGGLVRAYSHSASIAVAAGGIVTRAMCARLKVTCDYYFYGKLSSLVPENGGIIEDTIFEDNVTLVFRLPLELVDGLNAKLIDVSNGRYSVTKTDEFFADMD